MKITCTTTFLDGRERFEAGETLATESGQGCRVITEDQAARFVAAGWASADGTPAPDAGGPTETTLAVANVIHASEVRHG